MSNWLTTKQMSERHGIQETILRNWANLGYITSSRINDQLFLDDESLDAYLEAHKRLGLEAGTGIFVQLAFSAPVQCH